MKNRILFAILLVTVIVISVDHTLLAQCAMCKANAESSLKEGNETARGLNMGIMYLLVIPYLMIGALGYWWYVRNRKNNKTNA